MSNSILISEETAALNSRMYKGLYFKRVIFKMYIDAVWWVLFIADNSHALEK